MGGRELTTRSPRGTAIVALVPGITEPPVPGKADTEKEGLQIAALTEFNDNIREFLAPYEAGLAASLQLFNDNRISVGVTRIGRQLNHVPGKLLFASGVHQLQERTRRRKTHKHMLPEGAYFKMPDGNYPITGTYHIDRKTGQPVFDKLTQAWPGPNNNRFLEIAFHEGKISTIEYYELSQRPGSSEIWEAYGISFDGSELPHTAGTIDYRSTVSLGDKPRVYLGGGYYYFDVKTVDSSHPEGKFSPVHRAASLDKWNAPRNDGWTYDGYGPALTKDQFFNYANQILTLLAVPQPSPNQ